MQNLRELLLLLLSLNMHHHFTGDYIIKKFIRICQLFCLNSKLLPRPLASESLNKNYYFSTSPFSNFLNTSTKFEKLPQISGLFPIVNFSPNPIKTVSWHFSRTKQQENNLEITRDWNFLPHRIIVLNTEKSV